jgi:hypothetical protein
MWRRTLWDEGERLVDLVLGLSLASDLPRSLNVLVLGLMGLAVGAYTLVLYSGPYSLVAWARWFVVIWVLIFAVTAGSSGR